jgi:hypothetical protein
MIVDKSDYKYLYKVLQVQEDFGMVDHNKVSILPYHWRID